MLTVKLLRCHPDARFPVKGTQGAACYDLRSVESKLINPHTYDVFHTGWKIELQPGCVALIRPRSGLALYHGITVLNSPGTVDSDYRGELCVVLVNHSDTPYVVEKYEKIAQMAIEKVSSSSLVETDEELSETPRGEKGFNSTGKC